MVPTNTFILYTSVYITANQWIDLGVINQTHNGFTHNKMKISRYKKVGGETPPSYIIVLFPYTGENRINRLSCKSYHFGEMVSKPNQIVIILDMYMFNTFYLHCLSREVFIFKLTLSDEKKKFYSYFHDDVTFWK